MKLPVIAMSTLLMAGILMASEPAGAPAPLLPASQRKQAPEFALQDSSGKVVSLKDYRGKVVLLDFWATWCHGCKLEIPWFAELSRKFTDKDVAVVGVSLDSDGWKVVNPFIKAAQIPYQIVLGNDAVGRAYGIENMPDTFLIDRTGHIAAMYNGVVDIQNVDKNLRTMLSER
ncbi:MAG TPA: TlpA disulfide reductase family protein [Candidatus Sulfotelmatobacter sp.]|nr:TlpA disulfide reductase family protein [Candidatus Sulfotelmatobacter sp.]